eukprot:CAMPEP_0197853714 /NCGR_PEP_ID=MMETSP1438-20131217/23262_1 /TAXON_ID=1461541 /ORGANISM="Pterosperma sp., Strain CCMP1384" /LENGTH=369 /DNA_ID=CAMNT_0043468217 /DNA_START=107 /DNA_END=1213 /DNA_ORIENTATION=-
MTSITSKAPRPSRADLGRGYVANVLQSEWAVLQGNRPQQFSAAIIEKKPDNSEIVLESMSPDADVFASRLSAHGASDDFCSRIYSFGSTEVVNHQDKVVPPFRGGGSEARILARSILGSAHLPNMHRGYSTSPASARHRQGQDKPIQVKRYDDIDTSKVDMKSPRPVLPFRFPWDVEDEEDDKDSHKSTTPPRASTVHEEEPSPSTPLGVVGETSNSSSVNPPKVPPLKLWYDELRNGERKEAVRAIVNSDIKKTLLGSDEILQRLRPPGVMSRRTINYLSAPKRTMTERLSLPERDVLVWSHYKQAELVSAREEREYREQTESARRSRQKQALDKWKEEQKEEVHRRLNEVDEAAKSERAYKADLKRW